MILLPILNVSILPPGALNNETSGFSVLILPSLINSTVAMKSSGPARHFDAIEDKYSDKLHRATPMEATIET